jgi:hypothetical protein
VHFSLRDIYFFEISTKSFIFSKPSLRKSVSFLKSHFFKFLNAKADLEKKTIKNNGKMSLKKYS